MSHVRKFQRYAAYETPPFQYCNDATCSETKNLQPLLYAILIQKGVKQPFTIHGRAHVNALYSLQENCQQILSNLHRHRTSPYLYRTLH